MEKLELRLRTGREWTRTQREDEKTERQRKALGLYLQCLTQEEIAERLGWDRTTITKDLDDVKNGNSAENHQPDPLTLSDMLLNSSKKGILELDICSLQPRVEIAARVDPGFTLVRDRIAGMDELIACRAGPWKLGRA